MQLDPQNLVAYNIDVVKKGEEEFFGSRANSPLDHVNRSFLEFDYGQRIPRNADKIISHIDLASKSMIHDFVAELLGLLEFGSEGRLIRTRHTLRMVMYGENSTVRPDVCVMDMKGMLLLLVHEGDEPQVIVEAIAAF
ncbi:hypothetical protein K439DRAFT_871942 [Ramaria rubella]|nr:hypothetical protein K439DRAFT_871942 [Ramaria rubella]